MKNDQNAKRFVFWLIRFFFQYIRKYHIVWQISLFLFVYETNIIQICNEIVRINVHC